MDNTNIKWTPEDSKAAESEGWNVFFASPTDDEGDYRIERIDEAEIFESDFAVWNHLAWNKSPLHLKAIAFIKHENPTEYNTIKNSVSVSI